LTYHIKSNYLGTFVGRKLKKLNASTYSNRHITYMSTPRNYSSIVGQQKFHRLNVASRFSQQQ
jgi:hypothetical protein